jgi:hypothetical protein
VNVHGIGTASEHGVDSLTLWGYKTGFPR